MAFGRRSSPTRHRLVVQGRARIVLLAAGVAVAGGAVGGGVPALAEDLTKPPCAEVTTSMTVPVPVPDAADDPECVPADAEPTDTDTDTTGETAAATTPEPPVETTTTEAKTTAPPAPPAPDPADPQAPAAAPAAAAPAPAVRAAEATPQPPVAAPDAKVAPAAAAPAPRARAHTARKPAVRANGDADAGADDRSAAEDADSGDATPAKAHRRAKHHPDAAEDHEPAPVIDTAPLPASWTSLTPLVLPADEADGFPIPAYLLPLYQAAGAQFGVPWEVLAAINEIETDFGRNTAVSSAGALGWMQFLRGSWERWGTDGDGDHRRDPRNPVDAIFAAARYLRDAGAGTDIARAIFAYNHASWYVDHVVERARQFAGLDPTVVGALTARALQEDTHLYRARGNPFAGDGAMAPSPGQALLLTKRQLTRIVLHSAEIHVDAGGREDIAAGHVDRRVLATLVFLARSGLEPTVSCLITGHSLRTTSGNISAHSYGHAADISAINGIPIAGHQGPGSITARVLERLVQLQGYGEPNQLISLMTVEGHPNTLAMGDHDDHIHVGFPRLAELPGA